MESIDLEMEDMFDQEAGEDEDVGAHALHPELDDGEERPMRGEEEGNEEDDEEGVVANLQRLSKGAAKKRVMRPQPKLDVERLKSERGLTVLPELFKDVKFKGKGYEPQDLKLIMNKLEHWAHRLYPVATFDQFIEKMEKLGTKKPVQTLLKRIRLDMPILDNDFVAQYDDDDDDQVAPPVEDKAVEEEMDDVDAEEAFEAMLRQEREKTKKMHLDESDDVLLNESTKSPEMTVSKSRSSFNDDISDRVDTPEKMTPEPSVSGTETEIALDLKQRIEENRRKALLKRATKLGVPVESLLFPKKDGQVSQSQEAHETDCSQLPDKQQEVDNVNDSLDTQSQANSHLSSQSKADSQLTSQVQGSELIIPSEVACQKASQSGDSSSLPSELDTQSPEDSPDTTEKNDTGIVEDMKTEQELMNILEDDDDFGNSKISGNQQLVASEAETMQISSKEELDLKTKNGTLEDNLDAVNTSKAIVLSDGDNLNLQLDMSASDAVDTEEGDGLTLHMDLSVDEGTEN